jgi:mutator protein MutT
MQWAGAILVNRRGELLLNLRDDNDDMWPSAWDIIGGTVEDGETPDQGILREIAEETGQVLTFVQPFRRYAVPLTAGPDATLHVYFSTLDRQIDELLLGEGQEHRFFTPSGLTEIALVPGIEIVLDDFLSSNEYRTCLP